MSDTSAPVEFLKSTDVVIRQQALGAATSLIDYVSQGHCLIIGGTATALELAERLPTLSVSVLDIQSDLARPEKQLTDDGVAVFRSPPPTISGYLGAFQVVVSTDEREFDLAVMKMTETGHFDLILDLSDNTVIESRLPPFGYFVGNSEDRLAAALLQLPELTGEFDKPKYFDYNPDICAHSRSNLEGCSNCIDVCVADAISSSGEGISVNPFLCQGCGTCASVCPTGAMTYAYPRPSDAIERTREMLGKQSDKVRTLLIYSAGDDEEADQAYEAALPSHVMAIAVEESSAYGVDYWASMLSAGVDRIVVQGSEDPLNPNTVALQQQAAMFGSIVQGLGFPSDTVVCIAASTPELDAALGVPPGDARTIASSAKFSTHNDKRQTFRMAIDQLASAKPPSDPLVTLAAGSPFGAINVDTAACTLCMACVSVCPAGALMDGQELPKLRFVEANCVQCGMCEKACPETAITLTPQFIYDSSEARETRTLNEEEPFKCIRCHTPFATRKMIDNMTEKLAGHWMFNDPKATRRLKMCGDCRVMDMFEDDAKGINVHQKT